MKSTSHLLCLLPHDGCDGLSMLGLRMVSEGTGMVIQGASGSTWLYIATACVVVFFSTIFKPRWPQALSISRPYSHAYPPSLPSDQHLRFEMGLILLIGFALAWPFLTSRSSIDLATLVLIYVMLGLGLNIVVGLAGLLDLGYVAFYAVGAYSYALLNSYFGLSFWVCLPIAGLLAATFGFLLGFPVLRLRGDYLAIVTLGFGEIIRIFLNNLTSLTGGTRRHPGHSETHASHDQTDPEFALISLEFSRSSREGRALSHRFGLDYNPETKVVFLYLLAPAMCLPLSLSSVV